LDIRCFVELKIPYEIRSKLYSCASDLKQKLNPYLSTRVSSEDDLHITLKFFGNVFENRLEEISSSFEKIRLKPFLIKINGVNYFMNHKKITVVFAAIEISEELLKLKSEIDDAVLKLGFFPDERFFFHVTLLRVNKYRSFFDDEDFLNRNRKISEVIYGLKFAENLMNVNSFYFMRTNFTEHKTMHSVIKKFKLN